MGTTNQIKIAGNEIAIIAQPHIGDYICLTDMVKANSEDDRANILVQNWLRKKDTIAFVGFWEKLYNSDFNSIEFEAIKNSAGVNSFVLTPKDTRYSKHK